MTSNLGSDLLLQEGGKHALTKETILSLLDSTIKAHFRPEFLNRLDDILPFLPLRQEDMHKIVLIQLNRLAKRLADREMALEWNDGVVSFLAKEGYDPLFGARPLKRLMQQAIVNTLSNALLAGEIHGQQTVSLSMKNSETVNFTAKDFSEKT